MILVICLAVGARQQDPPELTPGFNRAGPKIPQKVL
jgi:hypothetical protein